jgi:sugar phosphate isomerase/epimerase
MDTERLSRRASITTDMFNYSFQLDLETKLRLFASQGFRFLHWCDDWNNGVLYSKEDVKLFCQLLESHGLKCQDVHGSDAPGIKIGSQDEGAFEKYVQLLRNRIEFCSAIGGDSVVVHPPKAASDYARSCKAIENVRTLCEDLGIVLAAEKFTPEFVGYCFDSGHANIYNNIDELMMFSSRLKVLHLHDNLGREDDHQPPFYGSVDWQRVMHWIEQSGYSKPLNFEITHRPRYFDGAPEEYLDYAARSILKALSAGT